MNDDVYTGRSERIAQHHQLFIFTPVVAFEVCLREPPRERDIPQDSVKGELVNDTLEATVPL